MTITAWKVDNRDAELAALREENAKLKTSKEHLLDVMIETLNALIRSERRHRK